MEKIKEKSEEIGFVKKINWEKWKKRILFGSLVIVLVIFSYYFGDMIEPWGV